MGAVGVVCIGSLALGMSAGGGGGGGVDRAPAAAAAGCVAACGDALAVEVAGRCCGAFVTLNVGVNSSTSPPPLLSVVVVLGGGDDAVD